MQDQNNNKITTTTTTTTSTDSESDKKNKNNEFIKKRNLNNNNNNTESEEEDEEDEEDNDESSNSDNGKKKKKGKKKGGKKKLKKLIERQQLQIEKLERERYQQQLHINQLSAIDENSDSLNKNSNNNNLINTTDILALPPPTMSNPLISENSDINWLNTSGQVSTNTTTTTFGNDSNSLLLPPPPKTVVQNIKPKKGSIYENEIQAFNTKRRSSSGGSASLVNINSDDIQQQPPVNGSTKNRKFVINNSPLTKSAPAPPIKGSKEPKVSLSALAAAQGKKIPVWRKVLSDDSKLFSNERTWMSWVGTTFSLGAIGTSIITFFGTESLSLFTGLCLWIIALGFLVYSYIIFRLRRRAILSKGKGPFDDRYGPIALVIMVMLSITLFLVFFILKKPTPLSKSKSN